jgi:hypothetical protein
MAVRAGWFLLLGMLGLAALSPAGGAEPEPGVSEEYRLLQVCRYLRLSRAQLGLLLPPARETDAVAMRLAAVTEAEEARIAGLTDAPAEAERARKALSGLRDRTGAEVSAFAGPQLMRVLTREQIALAWRLLHGNPPAYAAADPSLLDPAAGFANRARGRTLLLQFLGDTPAGAGAQILEGFVVEGGGALPEETRLLIPLAPGGLPGTPGRLGEGVLFDTGSRDSAAARPFPQRVVETVNPVELLPEVEPLVRRLFLSRDWYPALLGAYRRGLGVRPSRNHLLAARPPARIVRDYRMERGLRDQTGRGPTLETLGGALDHGRYVFGPGQGLRLADAGVRDDYRLEIAFSAGGGPDYQKLLDFKRGARDEGLYLYQGQVTFYTLAVGGEFRPGAEHRLRLERDRETRVVRAFLDLRPIFAFMDLDGAGVFEEGAGWFFLDDQTTRSEQGPGALRSVRVEAPIRT